MTQTIGERLAQYRRAAGLTAATLSDRLADGATSRSVIANIESGRKTDITVGQLIALSRALGISPASLAIAEGDLDGASEFCQPPLWGHRAIVVRYANDGIAEELDRVRALPPAERDAILKEWDVDRG